MTKEELRGAVAQIVIDEYRRGFTLEQFEETAKLVHASTETMFLSSTPFEDILAKVQTIT